MTSYIQSQFVISPKIDIEFLQQPIDSDSDDEENRHHQQLLLSHEKDSKKHKKMVDVDLVKEELDRREKRETATKPPQLRRFSQKKSLRSLNELIIPSSPILVEQLSQLKKFREIRSEVPQELFGRIISELRYQCIPALTPVYRQGDQNKNFYIVLEGKVVVLKPKQKMVGASRIEIDDKLFQQTKTDKDPYGLKTFFPDYLILKVLFQGDSFGEAAIKLDTARSSTVFALEQTHLLYLSENAYLEFINPYLSVAVDQKMKYFAKTPLFRLVEQEDYMGIVLESKLVTYKCGDIVYEEDDRTKYLYFILNGEIELVKQVGRQSIILSSYGELQCFGEVEILMKTHRFTQAKVLTPRMNAYRIRKRIFFDNLSCYGTYEQMKRHSGVIYKHWQLISSTVQNTMDRKDEIYVAAQNDLSNKPNLLNKTILHKKLIESQGSKLSQMKVFQNITEQHLKDLKQQDPYNQNILQRVYSNTLQKYQAKLLKKPSLILCQSDDNCIRNIIKQNTNTSINENNSTTTPLNENSIDQQLLSKRSSVMVKVDSTNKISLPTLHSVHVNSTNGAQPQSLDTVLESISKLPKVPKDNLVLSLMYQQAYKAENPTRKAKEIQQLIKASYRNVQNQFQQKQHYHTDGNSLSNEYRMKQNVKLSGLYQLTTRNHYLNFVQQKKICSLHQNA